MAGLVVWTDEKKEQIRLMSEDGKTTRQIAETFGRDPHVMRHVLRKLRIPRPGYVSNDWPHERVERLRTLWAEGKTGSQIAGLLGLSRNAVIGKVHRLKLPGRTKTERKPIVRKPRTRTSSRKERRRVNQYGATGPRVFDFVDVGCDLAPTHADNPCSLWDLSNNGCHWPCEGEGINTVFCGGTRFNEHSYCLRHCQLAYRRR